MSSESNQLIHQLEELRKSLQSSIDHAIEAASIATELGGEFQQEITSDLDEIQINVQEQIDHIDAIIDEAKTLQNDEQELELNLRAGIDDEENYKINSEHIQEERIQEREEKRESTSPT
jgi:hypothetical protein